MVPNYFNSMLLCDQDRTAKYQSAINSATKPPPKPKGTFSRPRACDDT